MCGYKGLKCNTKISDKQIGLCLLVTEAKIVEGYQTFWKFMVIIPLFVIEL